MTTSAHGKGICAYCGKPYGQRRIRTERTFLPDIPGSSEPPIAEPYSGNAVVIEERHAPTTQRWHEGDRAVDLPGHLSFEGVGTSLGHPDARRGRYVERRLWTPGDYCKPYGSFCTLRCAANMGVSAYKAGYRVKT